MSDVALRPARLSPADVLRVGAVGLSTRPMRVFLSALGIAIGIATMVAVVGISNSSKADLMVKLDHLGTDMLTVEAGAALDGGDETPKLPKGAVAMVSRIGPVHQVSALALLKDATVRRTQLVPAERNGGINVMAADPALLGAVSGGMAHGRWFTRATLAYPTVVLGHLAAERLAAKPGELVWIGEDRFTVIGVLEPVELAADLDTAALVGWQAAQKRLGFDGHPTRLYERSSDAAVASIRGVLSRTVNPQAPETVQVSRPSDALTAKAAASGSLTSLMLGLGAVALLVGGVGVANTMIISVLERRQEIGLRRSIGATRGQIRIQFLTEALLLSGLGGVIGALLGALGTFGFATAKGWQVVVPPWAVGGGLGSTVVIGMIAGLYPAVRASRLCPTEALGSG
ncbi:ABC transporter permease [Streptomyces sp. WZ.A104]|uniref:ABC transporter permease n=1 Tax=Streptomyces sp. WZ.A104 TaxID=2023771 RepID=UPI000BBBA45B|nr:ABC transporter permease [Streptomyces sp. WZ.A104]PCG87072.1 ABC transporter permease [Streptomyces sp. WZ.A104]